MEENQKQALLHAAVELLKEAAEPQAVTSRQLAAHAGVNAAMVNYYFGSKEELVSQAVEKILDESSGLFKQPPNPADTPKERLRKTLQSICGIVLKYRRYTKIYVPHLLLEDDIAQPLLILPEIRAHFGTRRDETDCRILAYELVSFMQLVFYRSEAFLRYAGIDLSQEEACSQLIDKELEYLLPEN